MKELTKQQKDDLLKYTRPIAIFLVIVLPALNTALQIELNTAGSIGLHWIMFISISIGAGIATIIEMIIRVYQLRSDSDTTEIEALTNQLTQAKLRISITEKDLMLNSAMYNETWLIDNAKIEDLEKIIAIKTARMEAKIQE